MTNFTDLGLAEPILRAVTALGHTQPTPIQAAAVPALIAGHDVMGIAQTGTGKTGSFVLPMLHLLAQGERAAPRRCRALVLSPTRELAGQTADAIRDYGKFLKLSHTVIVGGMKHGPQIRALTAGVDILVATPGRLLDHIKAGKVSLEDAQMLVLDEADQMLDMGFVPAIRQIVRMLPKDRRTAMLSATMPKVIKALAAEFLRDPVEVAVAAVARPIERIDQFVLHTPTGTKPAVLRRLLDDPDASRVIVFTRTKRGAEKVAKHLAGTGVRSNAIHGNKSQPQRARTLAGFRSGATQVLVATDVMARGIDVDDVSHVINFDLPEIAESYVHRIGRTGRAGRAGAAISLCDPSERRLLRDIERLIGARIDSAHAEPVDGDAAALDAPAADTLDLDETPRRPRPQNRGKGQNTKPRAKADRKESNKGGQSSEERAAAPRRGPPPRSQKSRSHKPGDKSGGPREDGARRRGPQNGAQGKPAHARAGAKKSHRKGPRPQAAQG